MSTPPEIQRKVSQVGHDMEDVYGLVDATNKAVTTIARVQRRQGTRLEEI